MMTPARAMAEVAVHVYNQHARDNMAHAPLGGQRCHECAALSEAAATLQEQATKEVRP